MYKFGKHVSTMFTKKLSDTTLEVIKIKTKPAYKG